MRVAILGANGFIGTRLIEQAHFEQRFTVVPIVRRASAAASICRLRLECRVADVLDQHSLIESLQGCDGVVHAAAGDRRLITESVVQVYRAARQARLKFFIYLSSMAVHGWQPSPNTHESSPLVPRHAIPYNNWKIVAEQRLAQVARDGQLRVVVLRPGIVYGPRSQWTVGFLDQLLRQQAGVVQDGQGVCNAIYVDNLNQAIFLAAEHQGLHGEAFLVNDARPITWREFYEPLCRMVGRSWSDVMPVFPPAAQQSWRERYEACRDANATQALLRWVPVRVRYALSQAADAWIDNPLATSRDQLRGHDVGRPPAVQISRELAQLQQCTYAFPIEKSRRLLNYEPLVTYDEACERTRAWLKFAEYPVLDNQKPAGTR